MWYVYIILCEDDSLYTGITTDPQRRFEQHRTGTGSRYTRTHKPLKIVHLEEWKTRSEASIREYEIKQLPSNLKRKLTNMLRSERE